MNSYSTHIYIVIYTYIVHVFLHFLYIKTYEYNSILVCSRVYCRYEYNRNHIIMYMYHCDHYHYWYYYFVHRDMPRFMHLTLNHGVPKWGAPKLNLFGIVLVDPFWGSNNFGPYLFLCSSYPTEKHLLYIDKKSQKTTAAYLGEYVIVFSNGKGVPFQEGEPCSYPVHVGVKQIMHSVKLT